MLTIRSGDFFCGGRYRTRTARHRRRRGNKSPSGALISARFPTHRNVYQERCHFVASSTNPRQSRTVQDSNRAALTTPVGRASNQPSGLLLSPRFPTRRNVYQERCHFVASSTNPRQSGTVQDLNRAALRSRVSNRPVQRRRPLPAAETGRSCWGSVLIFQSPAKGLQKNQKTQPVSVA